MRQSRNDIPRLPHDAKSVKLLGSAADEGVTWDVYAIVHRDGAARTYALAT